MKKGILKVAINENVLFLYLVKIKIKGKKGKK